MADVVLKRHCKLLSFFTIINIKDYPETVAIAGNTRAHVIYTLRSCTNTNGD